MTEEVKSEGGESPPPQLTEIEQRAATQGWRPKDEWDGDPEAWRPAKEFLDRGELFKKIDDQNRTIKEFKRTLDEFAKHHAKVRETEFKRALDELRLAKREALREQDADAVIEIDERIEAVRDAQRAAPAEEVKVPEVPEVNPVFVAWTERNSWYNTSEPMRAYADRVGLKLGNSGMSPAEILAEVERQVKKEFAHKFENPRRGQAAAVEGGNNKQGGKKDSFQLTTEQRQMMNRFVRAGIITEEQYIKDLKQAMEKE